MTLGLLMASAAPSLTIQLPTIVAVAAVVITILLALLSYMVGLAMWTGKREIERNDEAHRVLRTDIKVVEADVKQLLVGQARIEGLLGQLGAGKRSTRDPEHLLQQPSQLQ